VLTPRDVANRLGVSLATVYALLASGKLTAYRIGIGRGTYRVSEDQLSAYLASAEPPKPAATAPASSVRLKHLH
jgi:excisionase family DNA binding protein